MFAFIGILIEIKCSFSNVYTGMWRIYLANMKAEYKGWSGNKYAGQGTDYYSDLLLIDINIFCGLEWIS